MDVEDKIRKLMRQMDVKCQSCGSDCLSKEDEVDTDVGIMDTLVCADCSAMFTQVSSCQTFFIDEGTATLGDQDFG